MQFPSPSRVGVGDVELAVYERGSGRPVVLVHGFPEYAYSWRHQLEDLARAGYRAIAYDMRGYGESDAPPSVSEYGIEAVVADLAGLIDALELEDPVAIGHDWGSVVVQSTVLMRPGTLAAAGSLNVPYRGWCTAFPSTEYMREHMSDRFGYVLWFNDGSKADEAFAADPARFLMGFYDGVAAVKDFLSADDFERYLETFTTTGITPALNYYRNIDANLQATAHLANAPIDIPYLMVAADGDPVLPVQLVDGMDRWVPDLHTVVVDGAGHWIQQEQPTAVSDAIVGFLEGVR